MTKGNFLFVGFFLLALLTDYIFLDFVPNEVKVYHFLVKLLPFIAFALALYYLNSMSSGFRIMFFILLLYFFILSLESYYYYQSFFRYPHVFSKITNLFLFFGFYAFFKANYKFNASTIFYITCVAFFFFFLLFRRELFTISAFLGHQRAYKSTSAFLMLLPYLYFFNKYITERSRTFLFLFVSTFLIIIFLQHRSVWIAMLIATIFNFLLLKIKLKRRFTIKTYFPDLFLFGLFGLLFSLVIFTYKPEILDKLSNEVYEIQHATTEGTGAWRVEQAISYWPYIQEHILFGMRFEGFELPVQFYVSDSDQTRFSDNSGHHFHSLYVDLSFYFGVIGLFILLAPLVFYIVHAIKKSQLSEVEYCLISFAFSGLVYGISYNLPTFYFCFAGLGLSLMESAKRKHHPSTPQLPHKSRNSISYHHL